MAMPLVIPANSSAAFQTNPVSSENWKFVPPELFFYWLMNFAVPAPFDHDVEYPAFDEITLFESFTDWKVQVAVQNSGTVPFCQVQGDFFYEGDLGTPFSNAGNFYRKTLNYSFINLGLLSEGQYFVTSTYKVTAINPDSGVRETISEKVLSMEFWANAYLFALQPPFSVAYQGRYYNWQDVTLPIGWTPLVFNHHIGSALPSAQDIFYFMHTGATVAPDVIVSDVSVLHSHVPIHNNFSKVPVSFSSAIDSLAVGTYQYTIRLEYVGSVTFGETVNITLNVLPEVSEEFVITPEELTFNVIVGSPFVGQQALSVSSEADWNLMSPIPEWLQLSQLNGSSNATVLVTPINFSTMPAGTYTTALVFVSGEITVTVPVTLNLVVYFENPFLPSKLHFTKDLDFIRFNSSMLNTYVEITLNIKTYEVNTYAVKEYVRVFDLPLFQKKGEFHVGTIVHELLEEIESLNEVVPSTTTNFARPQHQPAKIEVSFIEKTYGIYLGPPFQDFFSATLDPFYMIKGHKPFMTEGQLSLLTTMQQEVSRITPRSVIGFSFSHFGIPYIVIKKNSNLVEELIVPGFPTGDVQKVVYSYFQFVSDLKPGDILELLVFNGAEVRSQRFVVFPNGIESTYFLYENDNGLIEPFEFSGRRRIYSNYKHVTASKFKGLFGFNTKVKADNKQSVTVNTGQLLPGDHRVVDSIIKSRKVWCSFDNPSGPYFPVDASTSKLIPKDTAATETDFDVEFNLLTDADAIIYPF